MRNHFPSYLPLIVFTGVFPVAVGLLLPAAVVLCVPGVVPWPVGEERTVLKVTSIAHHALCFVPVAWLLGIPALLVAGLHLGRRLRAPLAGLRVGRSWLSTEVVLAGAFVVLAYAAGLVTLFLEVETASRVQVVLAALAGLGAVTALARVYALPGQTGWRGFDRTAAAPVTMAFAAAVVWWATAKPDCRAVANVLLAVLLALDTTLAAIRSGRLIRTVRSGDPAIQHPGAARLVAWLVPVRFGIVALLLFVLVSVDSARAMRAGSLVPWAIAILVVVSLLDRFAFYAGAARSSPRAAMDRLRLDRLSRAATAAACEAASEIQPRVGK